MTWGYGTAYRRMLAPEPGLSANGPGGHRGSSGRDQTGRMITVYGVVALSFMMLMYLFEKKGPGFILAFVAGCALSSSYGFLSGAWPFGVVEGIWAFIAFRRWYLVRSEPPAGA
jgi:hypothetical protein